MRMTAPLEIGLTVRDLSRMRTFYEDVVGLDFVSEIYVPAAKAREAAMSAYGYTVVRLQTSNGERIKLLAPDDVPPEREAVADQVLDRADATYVTFIVDDIASVTARLIAGGAHAMSGHEPVEVRPGTFLAFLRDPEGHIVEIVQYADVDGYRPDRAGQ